ncbi:hypothetical protein D3C71_1659240 [compost metagenome]
MGDHLLTIRAKVRVPAQCVNAVRFQLPQVIPPAAAVIKQRIVTVEITMACQHLHGGREFMANQRGLMAINLWAFLFGRQGGGAKQASINQLVAVSCDKPFPRGFEANHAGMIVKSRQHSFFGDLAAALCLWVIGG